jgi:hypothetical protein
MKEEGLLEDEEQEEQTKFTSLEYLYEQFVPVFCSEVKPVDCKKLELK